MADVLDEAPPAEDTDTAADDGETTKVTYSETETQHGEDSHGVNDLEAYFGGEDTYYGDTSTGGSYFEGASGFSYGEYEESDIHGVLADSTKTDATGATEDISEGKRQAKRGSDIRISPSFELELDVEEQRVEEIVSEISSDSTITPLNREPYYENYLELLEHYGVVKRMNNYLHKKMSEYFRKRKMEHVLREGAEHIEEALMKYGMKIDKFKELIDLDKAQRQTITADVLRMTDIRDNLYKDAANNASKLMARQREIGTGLISEKTGKEMPEKYMEKLISNQRSKAKELEQLRLTHIKIRNAVAEKHAAIKALDKIGDNYTLIEFEQLKIENQGHADKIEEREEDLSRLRKKCSGAIQCLAHIREKCSAIEVNIGLLKQKLDVKRRNKTNARERMNELKQRRDNYRLETRRLREENGLMTKDKLLIDMESALQEIETLKLTIAVTQARFDDKKNKLAMLKRNYERELQRKRRGISTSRESSTGARYGSVTRRTQMYKRRPSIYMPKFEDDDDEDI